MARAQGKHREFGISFSVATLRLGGPAYLIVSKWPSTVHKTLPGVLRVQESRSDIRNKAKQKHKNKTIQWIGVMSCYPIWLRQFV